ncbi:MAG: aspartate/glutamate racemase family protein [Pseudomonadota bacterium]
MTKPDSPLADVRASSVAPAFQDPSAICRFGLIALSTDLTIEGDAARLFHDGTSAIHVTRVQHDNPTTPENLRKMAPKLEAATDLLVPSLPLAAILFACTSASVSIGDAVVVDAIQRSRPDVPVVTPASAAVDAFKALGLRRLALVTPYLVETTEPMAAYFKTAGFDLITAECLGVADDRDIGRITTESIINAAKAADRPEVEGIFLSCTALPAFGVIDDIEVALGKPVVTSNQSSFWKLCQISDLVAPEHAPGTLFNLSRKRVI